MTPKAFCLFSGKIILNIIQQFRIYLSYLFIQKSYSQFGEDLVIKNHLEWLGKDPKSKGFYVDIGAYHPLGASNTYKLYKNGSSGVAVDVGSQKKILFNLLRRRDIFIDAAVVTDNYSDKFVMFNIDGYGSESDSVVGYGIGDAKVHNSHNTRKVKALTISELLRYSFSTKPADNANWSVLNIDIEGLDEDVIKSIDFEKYPFDIICVEVFPLDEWNKINEYLNSPVNKTMDAAGYSLQSICGPTLIYLRKKSLLRK